MQAHSEFDQPALELFTPGQFNQLPSVLTVPSSPIVLFVNPGQLLKHSAVSDDVAMNDHNTSLLSSCDDITNDRATIQKQIIPASGARPIVHESSTITRRKRYVFCACVTDCLELVVQIRTLSRTGTIHLVNSENVDVYNVECGGKRYDMGLIPVESSSASIKLPCTQCAKKGLPCGEEDKVWGLKRQLQEGESSTQTGTESTFIIRQRPKKARAAGISYGVPLSDDEGISSFEAMCISYYFENLFDFDADGVTNCLGASFILRRFGPTLTSKSVRNAIVLNSIRDLRCRESLVVGNHQELDYLGRVYRYAQVAIKQNAVFDLVYTCYGLCQYAYVADLPFDEVTKHVSGFLQSAEKLEKTSLASGEIVLLLSMWTDIIWGLLEVYGQRALQSSMQFEFAFPIFESAFKSSFTIAPLPNNHWQDILDDLRRTILLQRLFFHFEYVRFNSFAGNENVDQSVADVVNYMLQELSETLWRSFSFREGFEDQRKFCHSTRPDIFLAPPPLRRDGNNIWALHSILEYSKFHLLAVIYEIKSPDIRAFGVSNMEIVIIVLRCWLSLRSTEHRIWWDHAYALFLAGLVIAKSPFHEGFNPF